jgi:hypothetical protein
VLAAQYKNQGYNYKKKNAKSTAKTYPKAKKRRNKMETKGVFGFGIQRNGMKPFCTWRRF